MQNNKCRNMYVNEKERTLITYNMKEKMKLLLIEDDELKCRRFKDMEKSNDQIVFVATTKSSTEGIKYVKRFMPDGIILDLELNNGEGSGFDFLKEVNKLTLSVMPKIVVTTNVCSQSVYDYLHKNNVDFIFYKKQQSYSEENVINTLLLLKGYDKVNESEKIRNCEKANKDEFEETLSQIIDRELELIGVAKHLIGKKYLHDAIRYVLLHQGQEDQMPVVKYLSAVYKAPTSTISRNMSNAIIHAWKISAPEDLEKYYTARIDIETGVPKPNEFIYYYVDKIKKEIE